MKHLQIVLLIIAAISANGCRFIKLNVNGENLTIDDRGKERVRPSNNIISQTVQTEDFDSIISKGKADIRFVPSEGESSVEVRAADNIIGLVTIESHNGTLTVDMNENYRYNGDVDVDVTVYGKTLNSVTVLGACDFECKDRLKSDSMKITVKGAGDIDLAGVQADSFKVEVSGAGDIEIDEINSGDIDIDIKGAGDAEISGISAKSITVGISGAGSAELSGKADKASLSIKGAGSIDIKHLLCNDVDKIINGIGTIN